MILFHWNSDHLKKMQERFGNKHVPTADLAEYARQLVTDIDPMNSPDQAFLLWLNRETHLFKAWEKNLIDIKLQKGFTSSDEFIKYSLSVINRRKSRMGLSSRKSS